MSAWSSESPTTRQVGQWVGCEDDDGLIVVHPERETCAVCQQASPVSTSAESPANTPVEPAGASEPPSDDLPELWRQKCYPHIDADTFRKLLCDLTAEGWDDVRKEVLALQSIVDSRPAPVSPVAPEPPTETRLKELPKAAAKMLRETRELGCKRDQPCGVHTEPTWTCGFCLHNALEEIESRLIQQERSVRSTPAPTGAPAPCVWRDIASAPKDGTLVLLANANDPAWPMRCRRWENDHWRGHDAEAATHWASLPGHPLTVER